MNNLNINDQLKLPEEQLLETIGRLSSDQSASFRPTDLLTAGRRWVRRRQKRFAEMICGSKRIRSLVEQDAELVTIASAVADLIIGQCGGVPATTVAVLLCKRGITSLCDGRWL